MNRPYNYQVYKDCIDKIYSIWSNATITTDIMIGFPTETEVDFLQTLSAIEECGFLKVHIFPFSLHKQTSAAKLKNNVSLKEKKLRMLKAIQVSNSVSTKIKSQFIGRTLSVFIEENINGLWFGYSENYIPNLIYSDMDLQGRIVSVIPEKLMDNNKQISLFSKKISILP
jgi:threonylcarbamoyladenosine tRNA methylthiotransferase MtaB